MQEPQHHAPLHQPLSLCPYRSANRNKFMTTGDIIINPFNPSSTPPITPQESASELPTLPLDLKAWQHQQEKNLLEMALQQGRSNQRKAADLLGLTYHQWRGMLKKHTLLQSGEPENE
ncbi:hypothetical protein Z042_00100 [Chania multitudinisentens RB-25]|uniref:Uncharacterized protein n=1 Tax=Chania multitudinisentens RB-25 TaxID=1441930 RepID=W0LFA4_9GAMM|nr:hypothetical protein Z042_00100 [Chania multitudinisentens RB-25]